MVSRVTGRFAVLLVALWLAVPVPRGLVAAPDPVSRAEAWFDDISTMKADFIQVASDGTTATGELHLRRPHRMKIIYDLDEPLILLTTPAWLHVDRPKEKTVTSYPINETPLSLILREDVELRSSDDDPWPGEVVCGRSFFVGLPQRRGQTVQRRVWGIYVSGDASAPVHFTVHRGNLAASWFLKADEREP